MKGLARCEMVEIDRQCRIILQRPEAAGTSLEMNRHIGVNSRAFANSRGNVSALSGSSPQCSHAGGWNFNLKRRNDRIAEQVFRHRLFLTFLLSGCAVGR